MYYYLLHIMMRALNEAVHHVTSYVGNQQLNIDQKAIAAA
jgi:hypothetical protein